MRTKNRETNSSAGLVLADVSFGAFGIVLVLLVITIQNVGRREAQPSDAPDPQKTMSEDLADYITPECEIPRGQSQVSIEIWDDIDVDGDLMKLVLNQHTIIENLELSAPQNPWTHTLQLDPSRSFHFLQSHAISEGRNHPFTGKLKITPCRQAAPQIFNLEMAAGDKHIIVIKSL